MKLIEKHVHLCIGTDLRIANVFARTHMHSLVVQFPRGGNGVAMLNKFPTMNIGKLNIS